MVVQTKVAYTGVRAAGMQLCARMGHHSLPAVVLHNHSTGRIIPLFGSHVRHQHPCQQL
jgi:hypothetical protein